MATIKAIFNNDTRRFGLGDQRPSAADLVASLASRFDVDLGDGGDAAALFQRFDLRIVHDVLVPAALRLTSLSELDAFLSTFDFDAAAATGRPLRVAIAPRVVPATTTTTTTATSPVRGKDAGDTEAAASVASKASEAHAAAVERLDAAKTRLQQAKELHGEELQQARARLAAVREQGSARLAALREDVAAAKAMVAVCKETMKLAGGKSLIKRKASK
jgi:hypothetical protein